MIEKDTPEEVDTTFEGSNVALLQRISGGIICIVSPVFLIYGIIDKGTVWDIHKALAIVILVCSLYLLFLLEGTQIAVVRLKEGGFVSPVVFKESPDMAELLTRMGEHGVANYLIGRQVLVCANVYLVSLVTALDSALINHSLTVVAGIFTVVCYGQLIPQLMADINPILFCRMYGVREIIHISSFISKCGVGHFAYWIGKLVLLRIANMNGIDQKKALESYVNSSNDDAGQPQTANRVKSEHLSQDILDKLDFPLSITKKGVHVSPHLLLSCSKGLRNPDTSEQAETLLREILESVPEDKKDDLAKFLRAGSATPMS